MTAKLWRTMFPMTSDSFQHGTKIAMRRGVAASGVAAMAGLGCRRQWARQIRTGMKSSIPLTSNAMASVPNSHGQSEEKTKIVTMIPIDKVAFAFGNRRNL
jgi:hypothetical protein